MTDDLLSHTAHEHVSQTSSAMGGEHYQIDAQWLLPPGPRSGEFRYSPPDWV